MKKIPARGRLGRRGQNACHPSKRKNLDGKFHRGPLVDDACDIEIEKVSIQDGLHHSSYGGNRVKERFSVVSKVMIMKRN